MQRLRATERSTQVRGPSSEHDSQPRPCRSREQPEVARSLLSEGMPHKQLSFRSVAREKVLRGASTLADAVRVTLGPKSGAPIVWNDGITIAKEVEAIPPGSAHSGCDDM